MEDEIRQKSKKFRQEEEEEERKINECYVRMGYMLESCQEYDPEIYGLIEEHMGRLESLYMRKREVQDDWEKICRRGS